MTRPVLERVANPFQPAWDPAQDRDQRGQLGGGGLAQRFPGTGFVLRDDPDG